MFYLVLSLGILRTCAGGGLYSLAQSQVVSTSEAHGPLARIALSSAGVSHPLQYFAASAPAVAHAPVVSVPVTKYLTHPGYLQRLVDVPTTKLAKAKLQVRRPAIQKQFYDVEQSIVVRPVGSAVVELNEPLSKNLISPVPSSPTIQHTEAKYPQQIIYPVNAYPYPFAPYGPFQVPVQSYPPAFIGQQPGLVPQTPQQIPLYPQPPQQFLPQAPSEDQQPQQVPSQSQPSRPSPGESSENDDSSEFDSSDTVVIDNPDFERFGGRATSALPTNNSSDSEKAIKHNTKQDERIKQSVDENYQIRNQKILDEFQSRQLSRMFSRQPVLQPLQRFQQIFPLQPFPLFQQPQAPNLDGTNQLHRILGLQSLAHINDNSEATNVTENSSSETTSYTTELSETTSKTELPQTTSSNEPDSIGSSLSSEESIQNIQVRKYSSEGQIPYVNNLSHEEAQDNQQKLIELLTGRGDISEIDLSRSGVRLSVIGDSGVVRGRVLSVTSAPSAEQLGNTRVSTRRVVVSRPIQTLEEIDVHQPFTKVERVAVQEPALLKTPHPHVATVVPLLASTPAALVYH